MTSCVCGVLQDAGISQVGFLLGSCGVGLALTSEICLKGLPKTPTGEILQFKGQQLVLVPGALESPQCKMHNMFIQFFFYEILQV